jgi:diacylglycerol kinase (ATP)
MDHKNVVFLINRKSGGRGGSELLNAVKDIKQSFFGEKITVFDILDFADPEHKENRLKELKNAFEFESENKSDSRNFVVLAGGDGTMKWGIEIISSLHLPDESYPRLGLIPLGTANELARVTGWRLNTRPRRIDFKKFLNDLFTGNNFSIDQWNYSFTPSQENKDSEEMHSKMKMICFASLGFDAKVAYKFHLKREENPKHTDSALKNKFWYVFYGFKRLFSKRSPFSEILKVECDGTSVQIPENYQSLQIFSISTAADGIYFWGKQKSKKSELQNWQNPSLNDQLLEVCSLKNTLHIVETKFKLGHSHRISQCKALKISILKGPVVIQIDGEAWPMPPGEISITFDRQVPMVQGPSKVFNVGQIEKSKLN